MSEDLINLAEAIKKRIRKDFDIVIAISGEEGIGKSVLAIHLAKYIDPFFTLEKNELISPSAEEMKEKITGLPKFSCIICDEAIRILYKLRWYTKIQVYLSQLFAVCRQENKVVILCLPRFKDFNEYFRNHRIKAWLHVMSRGTAVQFSKDWSPFSSDPWGLDDNQKLIEKYSGSRKAFADIDLDKKISLLAKLRNYVSLITFEDLDPITKSQYLNMKARTSYNDLESNLEHEGSAKLSRQRLATGILAKAINESGVTEELIGRATCFSRTGVDSMIQTATKHLSEAKRDKESYDILLHGLTRDDVK